MDGRDVSVAHRGRDIPSPCGSSPRPVVSVLFWLEFGLSHAAFGTGPLPNMLICERARTPHFGSGFDVVWCTFGLCRLRHEEWIIRVVR